MNYRKANRLMIIRNRRVITLCLVLLLVGACQADTGQAGTGRTDNAQTRRGDAAPATPTSSPEIFAEQSAQTGLVFKHFSGATGDYHVPEIVGSGVALFDYDDDGDLDVYFVQSARIDKSQTPLFPLPASQPPGHRLFANQLIPHGTFGFVDVTAEAGLTDEFVGMGVAVADYDNDGDADLYVLSYQDNVFYKNNQGVFVALDETHYKTDLRWSSSASFCDVNNDQWPDLYVTNYINYVPTQKVICRDTLGREDYCSPAAYTPTPDQLLINTRDGRFVDKSEEWGVHSTAGAGLGVLCRDLNGDGFQDIYVANDAMPNLLWTNQAGQGFRDDAQMLGAAININGLSEGSMGVTAGDYDFDGDDDLFLTHWDKETNTLYRNDADVGFMDVTAAANLASPSLSHTGFGTDWIDYDNDGDLDLFVSNGAVQRYVTKDGSLIAGYGQPNQIFRNDSGQRFVNVSASQGIAMLASNTGRGLAFGDLDNDGDIDVVESNKDGYAQLYMNKLGQNNHWLGLTLEGRVNARDAQGAIVTVTVEGRVIRRVLRRDGSYQSAHDPRIVIGLGQTKAPQKVTVEWPNGLTQTWSDLAPGRYHTLLQK